MEPSQGPKFSVTARGASPQHGVQPVLPGVERDDGTLATEISVLAGEHVVDIVHLGPARPTFSIKPTWLLILGTCACLSGASLFFDDINQDWDAHAQAVAAAYAARTMIPTAPGSGLASFGLLLGLVGLIPLTLGLMRRSDRPLCRFTLGEGPHASFPAPGEGLNHDPAFPLVEHDLLGDVRIVWTPQMTGELELTGHPQSLHELRKLAHVHTGDGAHSLTLRHGVRGWIAYEGLRFLLRSVPAARPVDMRPELDKSFWLNNFAVTVIVGALLSMVQLVPGDAQTMELDGGGRFGRFARYLHQRSIATSDIPLAHIGETKDHLDFPDARHPGGAGIVGNRTAGLPLTSRSAYASPRSAAASSSRTFDADLKARNAGMLRLVGQDDDNLLASPCGGQSTVGDEEEDIWAGLTGTAVGEAFGVGGIGLVGLGRHDSSPRSGRTPKPRAGRAQVVGALDRDIVRRIVRLHLNEIGDCHNRGLLRDPNLKGTVHIQFSIGSTGVVTVASVQQSTVGDATVERCIAAAVKRWRFPKPERAGTVLVTYPFTLATD